MLLHRDPEHHGCGLALEWCHFPVLDDAPEGGIFLPQIAEGAVPLDVVGQEYGSVSEMGPYGVELAAHVLTGVEAVVDEEVHCADLFEKVGQNPSTGPPVQPPAASEGFWHGYTPKL